MSFDVQIYEQNGKTGARKIAAFMQGITEYPKRCLNLLD